MTLNDFFVSSLQANQFLLKMHLGDMSDADLMVRPCPGANHAMWQLGHVVVSEARMVNQVRPGLVELPAGFAEKFTKATASVDDASKFVSKAELLAAFEKVRAATIQLAQSLTPEECDKPGPESMRQIAPTVGALMGLVTGHTLMHVGQIQVARRKVGKPVMF